MSHESRETAVEALRASRMDQARPRPHLVRDSYLDLGGAWGFAHDDDNLGVREGWQDGRPLAGAITVPFPPESADSGVGETGYHPVVWYRRELDEGDLARVGHAPGNRLILHFGAVDYRARVWLNGQAVGDHVGGHTPFAVDLTDALGREANTLVVRAEDDPHDVSQPRGKQDWMREPHTIWYHRTTGIWQPVWLESVPAQHVTDLCWTADLTAGTVSVELDLSLRRACRVHVTVAHDGVPLGAAQVSTSDTTTTLTFPLDGQRNGQASERLQWRPDSPTLLDAWVRVDVDGQPSDVVATYLGLRTVGWDDGAFLVNNRPVTLRSVLSQGYWPGSHLAAPSGDALRREAELIVELGFNAVRVHQKIEDDRFLYWADRLGLLVWAEMPAAYAFDQRAIRRTLTEWSAAVVRDRSHPSVVTWVPLNESWGVQHIASRPDQRALADALYFLTKALDPTRPVISNDGWEQSTSDLWTLHDYEADGAVLAARYGVEESALRAMLGGIGPAGRVVRLPGTVDTRQPIMLTEFGGVSWSPGEVPRDAWGYSEADSADDFARRIGAIFAAVQAGTRDGRGRSHGLAGWCWTQLTDTLQESNGLLTHDREPKLPMPVLRAIVQGTAQPPADETTADA